MTVLKHIKSRNANYSDAIDYLLFQHDENTGKKILDESGRPILREAYYIDGLLCTPESFDKECEITNKIFRKNQKASDIKSHHYIISYDPTDVEECGLTGRKSTSPQSGSCEENISGIPGSCRHTYRLTQQFWEYSYSYRYQQRAEIYGRKISLYVTAPRS